MCSLRARAYNATTIWKDYAEFFSGTSTAIGHIYQSVKSLRAEVIVRIFNSASHITVLTQTRLSDL